MELLGHLSLQCVVYLKFCKGVFIFWKCVLIFFPFLRLLSTQLIKNLQKSANLEPEFTGFFRYPTGSDIDDVVDDGIRAKFKMVFDGYRVMFDQSFSKSKDLEHLGDMVKLLPGVVVQNHLSIQEMADLYRIERDLLESLIEPLKLVPHNGVSLYTQYKMDDDLSGFLQDQDRSQLYYCDPILQHISICRHFLSLLGRSNAFRLRS